MNIPSSPPPDHSPPDRSVSSDKHRRLDQVDSWIFDLDNTLYPASSRLFDQVHGRMTDFIADRFALDRDTARERQRRYFRQYGTTLRGLMVADGVDPEEFLDYVHRIDLSVLLPCTALDQALTTLPGRKVIFTNGSQAHAAGILAHLGIARHFDGIFDIADAGYVPKPDPAGYDALLGRFGINPARAAMIEDMAKNLKPAWQLGITTVWVAGDIDWACEGADEEHVDFRCDDLAEWLSLRRGDEAS
jgi:putative hydrolase of the HAD superfamily